MDSESEQSISWQPNEEFVQMLIGMGISKNAAEHALYQTGNQSADAAASYVLDNPDIDKLPPLKFSPKKKKRVAKKPQEGDEAAASDQEEEEKESYSSYKMVFVVNCSLGMGPGKIAAQVGHACLGLYRALMEYKTMNEAIEEWYEDGEKKVVLKGDNRVQLKQLEKIAETNSILSYMVYDTGRTQVPSGSLTVLGLFGEDEKFKRIDQHPSKFMPA